MTSNNTNEAGSWFPGVLYVKYLKRIADITFSTLLLVVTSWLFLLILLSYFLSLQWPVFFKQERIGKNEKFFKLIKFRTLKPGNEQAKERRFFLGDVLRFLSLDELPQLIHVLRGEMSLVGPRPLPAEYLPLFSTSQRLRHTVVPGITGWAQVNGRHAIHWEEKFRLDNWYVANISFALDLKILLKTVFLFFSFRKDVSLEEPEFKGNM